jgi:hypothetical protein
MPALHVRMEVVDLWLHTGNSLVRVFPGLLDGEQRPDRRRVRSFPYLYTSALLPRRVILDLGQGDVVVGVSLLDGAIPHHLTILGV